MNQIKRNEKVHNMEMIKSWRQTKYDFFFHEVLHSKVNVLSEKVVLRIIEDIYFNQKKFMIKVHSIETLPWCSN